MNVAATSKASEATPFLERMLKGPQFNDVFNRVMSTVEGSAHYLDGEGRAAALAMDREGQARYSSAAMWLTTGLMRSASIVLLLRSVSEGAMPLEAATAELEKARNDEVRMRGLPDGVPEKLAALLEAHRKSNEEVNRLVAAVLRSNSVADPAPSPVHRNIQALEDALGAMRL